MHNYSKDLYNALVETSQRIALILQAFERSLCVNDLRVLELFAVYGEDVGFHKSLHNVTAARFHPYGFRESIIRESIEFLLCAQILGGDEEVGYRLVEPDLFSDESFVGCLSGEYTTEFSAVCDFMAKQADAKGFDTFIEELTVRAMEGLKAELDFPPSPIETDWFVRNLERDFYRMNSLQWTAYALAERAASLPAGTHARLDPVWLNGLYEAAKAEMVRVYNEQISVTSLRKSYGF
jgi:hypothetical protein